MGYCIVCKEIVKGRYNLSVRDSKHCIGIDAHICKDCFNRFLSSHANEGMFKVSRFLGWAKNKDRIRE